MTLNEIEKKANHFEGKIISIYNVKEVNKRILDIIRKCVNNNIKLDLNERDFVKILNIFYELYHTYDFNFFKEVANNSVNELDFYKIIKML